MCHVFVRADGLGATCVVNNDYPDRVAFTLLSTILDEFVQLHGDKWQGQTADDCLPLPSLEATLKKYQDPAEADKLMAIQKDLDQTKVRLPILARCFLPTPGPRRPRAPLRNGCVTAAAECAARGRRSCTTRSRRRWSAG